MPNPDDQNNQNDDDQKDQQNQDDQKGQKDDKTGETYVVKIGGKDEHLTLDELKTLASKSAGADRKFEQASETLKQGTKGVRVMELFGSLGKAAAAGETLPDVDINELAGYIGADPRTLKAGMMPDNEDAQEVYSGPVYMKDGKLVDKDGNEISATGRGAADNTPRQVALEDLTPDVQQAIQNANTQQMERVLKQIQDTCAEAVDKDEILGKMISEASDEDRESIRGVLSEMVFNDVRTRTTLMRQGYGADTIGEAVRTVRRQAKAFGIPKKAPEYPTELLGLSQSEGLPPEVFSNEPIKRTPVNEDEGKWLSSFVAKTLRRQVSGARGK